MVGHGEVHLVCGALLLGQLQTGAVPVLEHAGLGVLVCGGLELCTHGHSHQVGNSAAVLQGDLCIGDLELIGLGSVLGVLCFQRNVVCGHREGDGRLGGVHVSGQTFLLPAGEGVTVLLRCGGNELCAHTHSRQVGNIAAVLQGNLCISDIEFIGLGNVLGVLCFQRNVVCGHREGDGRLGGVHISRQTGHFPTGEGLTFHRLCSNSNVLFKVTLFVHAVHGQGIGVLLVLRGQRDVVCGHREGDSCLAGVRTLGHAIYLPTGEGVTSLLGCGKRDFLTKCTAFFLPVHGQGVVDRLIAVRHPHVIAGHGELEFDMRAGVGDGIRILCQTFDLPDNVIAFLLVNAKGDLIALIMRLAFLSIPVVVILRLGLLGHNIGAYLINSVIILGVGVSNIVLTRRHLDVHIVAAGGGGNRLALVGAVQQSHLRVGIVIIFAFVFHRVLGGIIVKVLNYGRVADSVLTHNNRTGLVFFAFLCNDGSLIAAKLVRIRYLVDKGHAFVYTGNALELKCALANAFWAGQREGAIPIRVGLKVLQFKALKGQLSGYGVSIRQLFNDAVVVIVILHIKPDVVGACLGGHFFRSGQPIICSAVLKGSLRNRIAEILRAVVACSTVLEVKAEVRACRPILPCTLTDQKFTALVQRALFGTDVHLIAAVLGFGREVVELLVVVGTHIDEAQLTHALLIAGNDRVLRSPANRKVALLQGREGQLSAGSHVHYNGLAVILGGQGQGLAICGKLCVRIISADSLAVDIRDRLAEGDRHRSIADKVNRVCCYGIAVDSIHSAVCDHQLALLLTGGKVFAFNIAAAYRIGNSDLAVITRQAAKDHGILDDRFLRGIARQLDIVEHTAGDLAVLVQLDLSVECAASDLAISADDILESAACDGAVFIHVDILLEGAVLNDGVLRTNRALCHDAGDSHICKSDLLHGNGLMVGVAGNRRKIHRVAVRGGDVERRACPSVLFHGGVLPAQTLIEVSRHALAAHRHTGHAGQVGQTLFGNAQRLEVAWIGGLIHKDLCAVILAGNAQHLAVGRGVGVVVFDRCIVDAQHIGVQGKFCAACAHQIDGIGGKRQSSAVHRSHTAVAHHQRAELLSCGQQLLDAVRQFAQNRIRNGVGVIAIGIEIAALDHRIGNRARAIAEQGIKGAAGDLDRTVPID